MALFGLFLVLTGAAQASPVTIDFHPVTIYFDGVGDFTLAGTSFTDKSFEISALGSNDAVVDAGGGASYIDVTNKFFKINGIRASALPLTRVGSFAGLISLFQPGGGTLSGTSAALGDFAFATAVRPTALAFPDSFGSFAIGGGQTFSLTSVRSLSFRMVPIPAALSLLATGLAAVAGTALRCRTVPA